MKKHYSHKCSVNRSKEHCEFYYSFNNESLFCFLILREWEQLIMLQINLNFLFQYKSSTIFISDLYCFWVSFVSTINKLPPYIVPII